MAATMRSARIGARDFIWGARTYVMGIVNVTPDSFSGDGVTDLETAVAQARQMEQDGADLIDIGGESTRPETWAGSGLSLEDELVRVIPVVTRAAGVADDRIIVDPGIGFGKTREENLEIIRRLAELRQLGFPLLIGPSRKSFIGKTLDLPAGDRLEGTAAAVALSIAGGADIVRVHDVKAMVRVARMADAIRQA